MLRKKKYKKHFADIKTPPSKNAQPLLFAGRTATARARGATDKCYVRIAEKYNHDIEERMEMHWR